MNVKTKIVTKGEEPNVTSFEPGIFYQHLTSRRVYYCAFGKSRINPYLLSIHPRIDDEYVTTKDYLPSSYKKFEGILEITQEK